MGAYNVYWTPTPVRTTFAPIKPVHLCARQLQKGNPIYAVLELGGTTHGEGVCCGSCRRRRRLRKVVGYNN